MVSAAGTRFENLVASHLLNRHPALASGSTIFLCAVDLAWKTPAGISPLEEVL